MAGFEATTFYNTYLGQSLAKPYAETQYTTDPLDRVKKVIPEFVGTELYRVRWTAN